MGAIPYANSLTHLLARAEPDIHFVLLPSGKPFRYLAQIALKVP